MFILQRFTCFRQACVLLDTLYCLFLCLLPFFMIVILPVAHFVQCGEKKSCYSFVYIPKPKSQSLGEAKPRLWLTAAHCFHPPPSSTPPLCEKIQYKEDLGAGTALPDPPEVDRVKRNQRNVSMVLARQSDPALHPPCSSPHPAPPKPSPSPNHSKPSPLANQPFSLHVIPSNDNHTTQHLLIDTLAFLVQVKSASWQCIYSKEKKKLRK